LLRQATQDKSITQFFADHPESFPEKSSDSDYLVVKNHIPHASLLALAGLTDAPILMSVREPKDAVASLMARFSYTFADAERAVAASAAALAQVGSHRANLLLRYEDGFFDDVATVRGVAFHLGLRVSRKTAQQIFDQLTPQQVVRKIAELQERGAFAPDCTATRFDLDTHWHPGHVGERRIGQFYTALSPSQQLCVAMASRAYCQEFRYCSAPPLSAARSGEPKTLRNEVAARSAALWKCLTRSVWPYWARSPSPSRPLTPR